ncbi:DgyrCDS9846 [Dimorphilus gyrociliatus]|uniref:RNA helicase n=1 Tax=Dimorphilus gyrociliatus TaxID=2664684 RepID=A0A7I8VYK4_9ANNE|nr:DgyrCDS9846 [Dimorphilus gyrociliatus]
MAESNTEMGEICIDSQNDHQGNQKAKDNQTTKKDFTAFNLKPELLQAMDKLEIKYPSKIQMEFIPKAISGESFVCTSRAGTGKTIIYILSTLQHLNPKDNQISILVLCHTRELAFQVSREYERFCKFMDGIRVSYICGGKPLKNDEEKIMENKPHIVVGTPGRLWALVQRGILHLHSVEHFILDECHDLLLVIDFRAAIQKILRLIPKRQQIMSFTPVITEDLQSLCEKYIKYNNKLE